MAGVRCLATVRQVGVDCSPMPIFETAREAALVLSGFLVSVRALTVPVAAVAIITIPTAIPIIAIPVIAAAAMAAVPSTIPAVVRSRGPRWLRTLGGGRAAEVELEAEAGVGIRAAAPSVQIIC